jgi:hypothetical protein
MTSSRQLKGSFFFSKGAIYDKSSTNLRDNVFGDLSVLLLREKFAPLPSIRLKKTCRTLSTALLAEGCMGVRFICYNSGKLQDKLTVL